MISFAQTLEEDVPDIGSIKNRVAGEVALPWLSHHRTYGSVSRRFLS